MTDPVFLAPTLRFGQTQVPLRSLQPGAVAVLEGEEGRHASRVHRLRAGQKLDIVDGEGTRLRCVVVSTPPASNNQSGLTVEVVETQTADAPLSRVVLVQALAKGGRDELAIETATELGVDSVVPWQAARSVVRWDGPKKTKGLQRWERVVTAATKQSRRSVRPSVADLLKTPELSQLIKDVTDDGGMVLLCHEQSSTPIGDVVRLLSRKPVGQVVIVVGPEGGVSEAELSAFVEAGAKPVLLGSSVLRSSTAGPAAIVAVNLGLGRWE